VYPSEGPVRSIDQLLANAQITWSSDEGSTLSAAERLVRATRRRLAQETTDEALRCGREELVYELNLTCALVLGDTRAAAVLAYLNDAERLEAEGALVFGCLLYLTGRAVAGCFWWRFAAGAGIHLGAYCLYLYHAQSGDYRDALYWRAESDALRTGPSAPCQATPQGPLLPDPVYHALLAQCRSGQKPRLPLGIELAVNQLLAEPEDADFGEIPRPSAQLPALLAGPA
jgi:hypothetical protein